MRIKGRMIALWPKSRRVKLFGLILTAGLVLAAAAFSLSGSIGSGGSGQAAALDNEPWPAFTMKYRVEGLYRGPGRTPAYDVVQLDYVDKNHWRVELLESSDPRQVGSWGRLDGTTITSYTAGVGASFVDQIVGDYAVPDEWLVPGKIKILPSRGYRQVGSERPDRLRFVGTFSSCFSPPGGPQICPEPNMINHTSTEEWTFTKDYGIPVGLVATGDDGQVYRRITVLSLTFNGLPRPPFSIP